MPLLDVTWVLSDPMFADKLDRVDRRQDVVGANGRTTPTVIAQFFDVSAVVTQQSPADLLRAEDGQRIPRRIFLASTFQFYAAEVDANGIRYQPDLIVWNGTEYIVTEKLSYSRFGPGFYEVVAESKTAIDYLQ